MKRMRILLSSESEPTPERSTISKKPKAVINLEKKKKLPLREKKRNDANENVR